MSLVPDLLFPTENVRYSKCRIICFHICIKCILAWEHLCPIKTTHSKIRFPLSEFMTGKIINDTRLPGSEENVFLQFGSCLSDSSVASSASSTISASMMMVSKSIMCSLTALMINMTTKLMISCYSLQRYHVLCDDSETNIPRQLKLMPYYSVHFIFR